MYNVPYREGCAYKDVPPCKIRTGHTACLTGRAVCTITVTLEQGDGDGEVSREEFEKFWEQRSATAC
jgi:hypothetical protein